MLRIETGDWQFTSKVCKFLVKAVLIFAMMSVTSCTPGTRNLEGARHTPMQVTETVQLPVIRTQQVQLSSTQKPTQAQMSPTNIILTLPVDAGKASWKQVVLPAGCDLAGITPDLNWFVLKNCRSNDGGEDGSYLVKVKSNGKIERTIPFPPAFGVNPAGDLAGFTTDSQKMIFHNGQTFKLVSIPDLQISQLTETTSGSFAYNNNGINPWSRDGQRFFGFRTTSFWKFAVFDSRKGSWITEDIRWRRGSQINWCGNSNEVVFIEGDVHAKTTAQLYTISDQTQKVLLESTGPLFLSGISCSPNQHWIAIGQHSLDDEQHFLWLINRITGSQSKFSYPLHGGALHNNGINDLIWSPDSNFLIFRGGFSKNDDFFVVVQISSGEVISIDSKVEVDTILAWSYDSKSILAYYIKTTENNLPQVIVQWITVIQ